MSDTTNLVEFVDEESPVDGATEVETDLTDSTDDQPGDAGDELDDEGNPIGDDEADYEEVERGDKRYKIHKDLKGDLLRLDDYTRKTQVHAEEVRRFEERVKSFEAASQDQLNAAIEAKGFKDRLDEINQLTEQDWQQIRAMDLQDGGDRYNRLVREMTTLPQKAQEAEAKSNAMRETVLKEQSELQTKQLEQGQQILARDIPGWGPELGAKLANFVGSEFGVTAEKHGAAFNDPALVKMAYAAFKAKESQRKAATTQKAQEAVKNSPPRVAKSAAPVNGLDDRLSAKEWAERRNAQLAKRGAL